MGLGKGQRRLACLGQCPGVLGQCHGLLHALGHVRDAQRRSHGTGLFGSLRKVEAVWAHHHGASAGGRFDQVLTAQWRKAAPQ